MAIDSKAFGAYDIRGIYPTVVNQELAYRVGRVFPELFNAKKIAVGHDVRLSSPTLRDSLERGLTEAGCEVFDIGQCGTEMMYFATGSNNFDGGIMVTASHNPKQYNGLKIVKKGVQPLDPTTELLKIRDEVLNENRNWQHIKPVGTIHRVDIMPEYIKCVLSYVDTKILKPFKVVVNCSNGSAGPVVNEIEKFLPFEIVKVHNDTDGDFPHGVPNPLLKECHAETSKAIIESGADCGVAFDGDFDRCFMFDENGNFIDGYYIVGFLAETFLKKHTGEKIIYEPRLIWNTIDIVENLGGVAVPSRLGHSFIKNKMREENAVYGGEMSAHHYFRDFYFCDSGMISWLLVMELMSHSEKTLSQILEDRISKYPVSGEINTKVADIEKVPEIISAIEKKYSAGGAVHKIDGLGIDFENWRFNVRGSATEPFIRLNVETRGDKKLLQEKTDELLAIIRK